VPSRPPPVRSRSRSSARLTVSLRRTRPPQVSVVSAVVDVPISMPGLISIRHDAQELCAERIGISLIEIRFFDEDADARKVTRAVVPRRGAELPEVLFSTFPFASPTPFVAHQAICQARILSSHRSSTRRRYPGSLRALNSRSRCQPQRMGALPKSPQRQPVHVQLLQISVYELC
jgi:hypothetical protein